MLKDNSYSEEIGSRYADALKSYGLGIANRIKGGFNYVKNSKIGRSAKFIHESNMEILGYTKDGLKNTAKEIFYLAKEAPQNLKDPNWWSRNKWNIASIAIPAAISIGIGIISTRYRIDIDRELVKHPIYFTSGVPKDFEGNKLFDFGNWNPFNYIPPKNSFPEFIAKYYPHYPYPPAIEVGGFEPLNGYESDVLSWRNWGGGYIEHAPAWLVSAGHHIRKKLKGKK
jgi:hypothetical protein